MPVLYFSYLRKPYKFEVCDRVYVQVQVQCCRCAAFVGFVAIADHYPHFSMCLCISAVYQVHRPFFFPHVVVPVIHTAICKYLNIVIVRGTRMIVRKCNGINENCAIVHEILLHVPHEYLRVLNYGGGSYIFAICNNVLRIRSLEFRYYYQIWHRLN